MARDLYSNDFDAGKYISRAIGRGRPWKSRLFGDLKWQQRGEMNLLNLLCPAAPPPPHTAIKSALDRPPVYEITMEVWLILG